MNLQIVPFTNQYLDQMAELYAQSYYDLPETIKNGEKYQQCLTRAKAVIQSEISEFPDLCFVALVDGGCQGAIICSALTDFLESVLEISSVQVVKDFQGQGIGKALLRQALAAGKARNLQKAMFMVDTSKPFPYEWYQSLGATPTGWAQYQLNFESLSL